ncbi:FG-GAP-like repeat-containing protein [Actinomadura rubrisoli]|nr:FG-GAP-like repeat-containing protein [Actinomadura rubrisoli]
MALAVVVAGGSLQVAAPRPAKAIENGEPVRWDTWAPAAQIWLDNPELGPRRYLCSSTVIAERWILTAKHCFKYGEVRQHFVMVGSGKRGQGKPYGIVAANFRHDLAIIETDPQDGPLPTGNAGYPFLGPNKRVKMRHTGGVQGWGRTCETCGPSPEITAAGTLVNDNEEGLRDAAGGPAYKVRVTYGARIHEGDSGSPVLHGDSHDRVEINGVVSRSITDSRKPADAYISPTYDEPGCATKNSCVHDWLRATGHMKEKPRDELRFAYRAMALGSSSTYGEGSSDGNGYRDILDQGLQKIAERNGQDTDDLTAKAKITNDKDDTPQVDMVGSVRVGRMADRDNEGWRGFLIDGIAGKASCSVKLYKPNVVTLLAGGNDVIQNFEMGGAIGRLESLIKQVSRDAGDAIVLVAPVQPFPDPARNARGKAFSAQIPGLVDRLVDSGVNAMYVDTGMELSDIGPDGIHPTDHGYDKTGAAFVKAATEANEQGWIPNPVYQDSGEVSDACGMKDDGTGTDDNSSKLGPNWEDRAVIQAQQYPSTNRFWMVDINKDGKAEFVTVDKDQNFRFWWNSGPSGKAWTPFVEGKNSYKPSPGAVGNQLRFGDVDGDGFPDCMVVNSQGGVFVSTWKGDEPSGSRMCMDDQKFAGGASVYSEGSAGTSPTIDPSTKIRFADVTGGGREDYLLIQADGTTTAWFNQGLQVDRTRPHLKWDHPKKISGALANPREIRYADINGDKRADRILITPKGGARAWINEGAKGAGGTYRDIGKIAGDGDLPPKDIQLADLDGDGKADFLRIGWTGVAHAWLNKLPADYFDTFHP